MDNFQLLLHEASPDVLVLSLRGEIDLANTDQIREAATAASDIYRCLVFDLTRVSFMDSSGLHLLVDADRTMKAAGRTVKVVNAHPSLAKVFELTGIDRVLTIVADREAALAPVA